MVLSMKWLSDYVKADMPIKEFCSAMTLSGSKVEGYETEGSDISNVVVGKILSVAPHENADALFVCQVEVGKDAPIQIVTNAKNVRAGDLVPVALDGASLPEGKIKKCKMRGVESFGMFCGLDTLGLTAHDIPCADPDGVLVLEREEGCPEITVGQDIKEALGYNDTCVEFEITPNRPDCLSVLGLAREAHATFDVPITIPEPTYKESSDSISDYVSVSVENKELCTRYTAGVVKNVKIGTSPRWLRERLRASGVRPINNLVDITNYVMLEYGQPMHAFDLRYVKDGKIVIRSAKKGESITTLDGTERSLDEEMLLICDSEKPIGVAGVMGGEYSGIMPDTTTVVFESAAFSGSSVRRTAKRLGMRSDASSRFEKGLDPQNVLPALKRAFHLVELLGCGEIVGGIIDCDSSVPLQKPVEFNPDKINTFLGTQLPREQMEGYLRRLNFTINGDTVTAPVGRIDVACGSDIAEEVARLYDYNNIPATPLRGSANARSTPEQHFAAKLENALTALGLYQINTFSFVSPKWFDKIRLSQNSPLRKTVVISNPLGEDTSVMRTAIIASMMEIVASNYNSRCEGLKLFEMGREYLPVLGRALPDEPKRVAIGMYGADVDFFTLKGVVMQLLSVLNINGCEVEAAKPEDGFEELTAFHPGRCAVIRKNGVSLAILGEIHPETAENYGIDGVRVYLAKLNQDKLLEAADAERTCKPLPKYPAVTRDLAIVCDDEIPVARLEAAIRKGVGSTLEKITLFDVYKGKQIEEGKKSVAYSFSMRSHDGTLTDEQADSAVKRVLKALGELGAELRK